MKLSNYKRLLGMDEIPQEEEMSAFDNPDNLEKAPVPTRATEAEDESKYPPFRIVIVSMMSIFMAFFLGALDRTIIGVAIPAISNQFQSFDDISWYEAAFLLAFCVSQFPIGKIYTFYSPKWTFAVLVAIFEIGSIVCAAAPSSWAFIIGRAITGVGGAGSLVGASVIMIELVPLRKQPKYQGLLGAVYGLSSIIGPLVGGVLTTKASWRWCFWINVPIGGVAFIGLLVFLPSTSPPEQIKATFWEKVWQFDPIGNAVLAPGIICLLLALQWGGTAYPWTDARVISLLVIGLVLLLVFAGIQWAQENGTLPPRIVRQRSIAAGIVVSFGIGVTLIIPTFFLPIWFQAVKGTSAVASGVRILPLFLGTVFSVIGSGIAISKTGYYAPWLILGRAITMVGIGLLTTLRVDTSTGEWIGYQIVLGVGTGMSLQQCTIAVQTILAKRDIPIGLTVIAFSQFLAGTISVSVCQTLLGNTLTSDLSKNLPEFDASLIFSSGATDIRGLVAKKELPIVLAAYNAGIDNLFYFTLGVSGISFVASLFMEWKSVKSRKIEP